MNGKNRDLDTQSPHATSKRSRQDCLVNSTLGTRQSAYIKDKTPTSAGVMLSVSATPSVLQFHVYIITVLANLNAEYDDSNPEKPLSLKEAMTLPYWNNFKKAIHAEFQSLIENDTWEYRKTLSGRAVLTSCWVFKIKKDRWSKILKLKAQ